MATVRLPTHDIARALSEGLTAASNAFTQAARTLRVGFNITLDTTNELWRSYYLAAGKYTFPIEGELIDTRINPPRPLTNFHPAAHVGFFPFALIAFVSSITIVPLVGNSITSSAKAFVWTANRALLDLPTAEQIPYAKFWGVDTADDQRGFIRNIYGSPGLLLGAIGGVITALAIIIGRMIKHSVFSFAATFSMMLDFSLEDKINYKDERSKTEKYFFGIVGCALGTVFGSITSFIVANALSFINMAKTAASAARNVGANTAITHYIGNDTRNPFNKYGVGAIGIILGAVAGSVLGLVNRLLVINTQSFFNMTKTMISTAWNVGSNDAITNYIGNDQRHPVNKYLFGGIGIILGAVHGGVLGLGILAGRIFRHSITSFNTLFITMLNFSLATKIEHQDVREANDKYGFGLVGCALGAVFGSITSFIVANALSFFNMTKTVMSAAYNVGSDSIITNYIKNDKRGDLNKYGVGIVSVILGAVAGSIISFIIANALSFFNMTRTVMSAAYNVGSDGIITNYIKNDKRGDLNKYGVSVISIILGAVAGGVLGFTIFASRCIKQSAPSWRALSGSLLNIGLRLYHPKFATPPFEGIGGDERLASEKGMGALGYVAACFTTGPIALVMLTLASAATLSIMFFSLITIGTGKLIRKLVSNSAFADNEGDDKELMVKFRNLRSSLNDSGLFGNEIVQNGDGKEKSWRAFVRSISLNSPTLTEKLLYSLLRAYRENNHELPDELFNQVINDVKDYCEKDPRATPEMIDQDKAEVQRIGDFLKDYLTNNDQAREASAKAALPSLYQHNAPVPFFTAVACTFWGGKKNAAALPPASDADQTLDDRQLSPAPI